MFYVVCDVVDGEARLADDDELDAYEWCDRATLADRVPSGLFEPVQQYLDETLA
jgi:8-oxo-dGTP diphosphatase